MSKEKRSISSATKRKINLLLLGLLYLILIIPLSQTNWYTTLYAFSPKLTTSLTNLFKSDLNWSVVKKNPPQGVAPAKQPLRLNNRNFKDGSFQRSFEDYFMRGNPLWGWLVRTCNQIAFSVFNQVTFNYGAPAFIGKDGQLLQAMYLNAFNRRRSLPEKVYLKKVRKIKRLRKLLAERGITLLITVSPNAIELYPELLPSSYIDPSRLSRKNSYDIMRPAIEAEGIDIIDSYQILLGMRDHFPFRFFGKGSAHWNNVASCIATNNIISKISTLTKKELKNFPCSPITYHEPIGDDDDLLKIANILFPKRYTEMMPYAPKAEQLYQTPPIRLLIVGTSFNFALLDHINKRNLADTKFFFYYKSVYTKQLRGSPLNKAKIDWENDIFKNDVIILESNYSGLGAIGYDFLDDAIRKLRYAKLTPAQKEALKLKKQKQAERLRKKRVLHPKAETLKKDSTDSEFDPFKEQG